MGRLKEKLRAVLCVFRAAECLKICVVKPYTFVAVYLSYIQKKSKPATKILCTYYSVI